MWEGLETLVLVLETVAIRSAMDTGEMLVCKHYLKRDWVLEGGETGGDLDWFAVRRGKHVLSMLSLTM